jgi:hypothetical protein
MNRHCASSRASSSLALDGPRAMGEWFASMQPAVVAVCLALAVVPATLCSQAPAISIPVRVANGAERARDGEPVSFGFPVPKAAGLLDPAALALRDAAGAEVRCQFKALSRWDAGRDDPRAPLKWVLATFAPRVAPRSVAELAVVAAAPAAREKIRCDVALDGSEITVRPAAGISISVPTRVFGPFSAVEAGGIEVVSAEGGLEMDAPGGKPVTPQVLAPTRIEEQGPVRVVLVQKGALGELRYTCRWTFHAGRAEASLDFRLENPLAYGLFDQAVPDGQQYFDRLEVAVPVAGGAAAVTTPMTAATVQEGQGFELRQTWTAGNPNDVLAGFSFTETSNGAKLAGGGRHPGAVDLSGPKGGVTVAVERFHENFPKALSARDGTLRVALFPEFGNGPEFRGQYATPASKDKPVDPQALQSYRFEGGRWKSHVMLFRFHGGAATRDDVALAAADLANPLVGYAAPAFVRASRAMGILWVERGLLAPEPSIDRFERFFDVVADDAAADPTGRLGRIGLPGFLDRGGTFGGRQPYGWENYGDIPWGEGYCDLHYDWPAAVLSGFLRTGDVRLFLRGREMARFRRDYGQNHAQDAREPWRGAAFYEKGWWHGNAMPGALSHNWVLGLLLHYAVTGDESSREAAIENAAMVLRSTPGDWSGWWGSRIPGWAIDCLVDSWNFLGDPRYIAEAGRAIARYESFELADGGGGFHLNPSSGTTTPWMENILFLAASKHVLATGSPQAMPLLLRMRDWFKRSCIIPPQGSPVAMTLPAVYEQWSPAGGKRPSVHHLWSMLACLSYSACVFDDQDDRFWATLLFESAARYWQEGASFKLKNPLNAASWSPITMRPLSFPNSESKVLANVLNYGAPHLAMRALAEGRL